MKRTYSGDLVASKTVGYGYDNFDPHEWIADKDNIALVNDRGDLNLFAFQSPGLYIGHFFYNSRGRQAVQVANEALFRVFSMPEVEVLVGMTPVDKKGARWLSRHIGFKSHGLIDTVPGECELFILTRKDYEEA